MSRGMKILSLVVGIVLCHTLVARDLFETDIEFEQIFSPDSGERKTASRLSGEQTIIFTSWVILPAGADQMFEPVSGYVQGWWDQILKDGPAGFLAGAGTEFAVQKWVSRLEPRFMYLNAQYRFFPHGTETRLEVKVMVSGLDKKWMPGLQKMMDDFLQTRLAPYVEDIHGNATIISAEFSQN
ncbi:MAG: hypothetical protein O6931_00525 [Gammaproteobacteria bacterium]|nr:hypothetical protein [Gammaproteobacteria bacterium]